MLGPNLYKTSFLIKLLKFYQIKYAYFGEKMVVFRYGNDDFKILKPKLKTLFNQWKDDEFFGDYDEILELFIKIVDYNDDFFEQIDRVINEMTYDFYISKRFVELQANISLWEELSANGEIVELNGVKKKIINNFFIVNYECFSWCYFYKYGIQENSLYYDFGNLMYALERNLIYLDKQTIADAVNISRLIPKVTYDNYMKNNKELSETLSNVGRYVEKINQYRENCNKFLSEIEKIENRLQNQRQEFNFIGLSNAFQKMKDDKSKELIKEKRFNWFLMTMIVLSLILKIVWSLNQVRLGELNLNILMIVITSFIVFIGILLYFFRISLYNIKAIQSQILQLDLRLSLCQFIHNYANDSKEMRENMKESLERFESVIFAPIVATDDKIPATLDGMEQLGRLVDMVKKL